MYKILAIKQSYRANVPYQNLNVEEIVLQDILPEIIKIFHGFKLYGKNQKSELFFIENEINQLKIHPGLLLFLTMKLQ